MGLNPLPIIGRETERKLDMSSPVVSRHLAEACAMVVRNIEMERQRESARALRQTAITVYHVPPEAVDRMPPP